MKYMKQTQIFKIQNHPTINVDPERIFNFYLEIVSKRYYSFVLNATKGILFDGFLLRKFKDSKRKMCDALIFRNNNGLFWVFCSDLRSFLHHVPAFVLEQHFAALKNIS